MTSSAGQKLHRLTYSEDVAKLCCRYGPYEYRRFKIKRGRSLAPGEVSSTGIYMVATAKCGSPLRATLIAGIAATHYDPTSRLIYEASLES